MVENWQLVIVATVGAVVTVIGIFGDRIWNKMFSAGSPAESAQQPRRAVEKRKQKASNDRAAMVDAVAAH